MTANTEPLSYSQSRVTSDGILKVLVSLVFLASFFAKFEPAFTDMFLGVSVAFGFFSGLKISKAIMPLLLFLLIYNLAGLISYMLIPVDLLDGKTYIIGLAMTSVSGVFFAAYIEADPVNRYHQIMKAYWVGATIGAILGLCSYFKVQPIYSVFPDFAGRAVGAYKDPNVFSTWLVLPAITMLQGFIIGTLRIRFLSVVSFILIFAALFLAFSRGAWINAVMAAMITIGFTFILSPTRGLRRRIVFSGLLGFGLLASAIALLLLIPQTRDLFLDRFTLVKSYDAGETGRFGNQLNSIPILQNLFFGLGPYQFAGIFGLAPHNTFLNSFSSAGWIGGSAYITLTISNFIVGIRTMFMRTPFQPMSIVVFACLFSVTLQGVQIDTEHWRHFYWMVGMTWGFFAASLVYVRLPATQAEIYDGWNLALPERAP